MYCLELTGKGIRENLALVNRYRKYISLAELDLALLGDASKGEVENLVRDAGVPLIIAGGAAERELLVAAAAAGAEYVEVDEEVLLADKGFAQEVEASGTELIRCIRFPEIVPEVLKSVVEEKARKGGLVKVLVELHGIAELLKLFRTAKELSHVGNKLLYGTGPYALPTYVLYRRFGSVWTCGAPERPAHGGKSESPANGKGKGVVRARWIEGVPEIDFLREVFRAAEIGEKTEIFGIIGNPVAHSRSPEIHNRWFQGRGIPAVYVPFLVDEVEPFFRFAEELPLQGFSVTVPHKGAVLPFLDSVEDAARKIGSCNTVLRRESTPGGDPEWTGSNTDYEGFLAPLKAALKKGRIRSALVVGAGGASRTVVHALRDNGVEVTITNRTTEKARQLAEETGASVLDIEELADSGPCDLIVQTTSVGMAPHMDADPLPGYRFGGEETVYDLIYTPEKTRFLSRAEECGCKIIGGAEMLRTQAEAQFRIFSRGESPPAS